MRIVRCCRTASCHYFPRMLNTELTMVPVGSPKNVDVAGELQSVLHRDARMVQLRAAQHSHHHKQVWTKDAHGGPYLKVATKARDKISESLQRAMVLSGPRDSPCRPEDLLGYERVEAGPTTNLVGNHMTRGAVELVQAELSGPAAAAPGRRGRALLPRRERGGEPVPKGQRAASDREAQSTIALRNDPQSLRLMARRLLTAMEKGPSEIGPVRIA